MKKILMLMIVAVLMLGVSGQAMAAFTDGDLVRVVFSTNGVNEVATDLGSVAAITVPDSNTIIWNANNFNLASLGGTADASNSYAVYFSIGTTASMGKNQVWASGPAGGQIVTKNAFSLFNTNSHSVMGNYQVAGGGASQVTMAMSDANSFWTRLASGGAGVGQLGTLISANNAAVSLASLGSIGYADQILYYYGTLGGLGNVAGVNVSDLKTYADGHSALNGPTTPIPAAVYLFGSGLMGLVGLRRKMAA